MSELPCGKLLNVDIRDYHSAGAMSATKLKLFDDSPLKYWRRYVAKTDVSERTDALNTGSAFHALMESDESYERQVVVNTRFDNFRTSEARSWRDANVATGKIIVSPAEHENLQRMKNGALKNPTVRLLIEGAEREVTWRARIGSTYLQTRTDIWNERGVTLPNGEYIPKLILDWKSMRSLCDNAFAKAVGEYGYDLSESFYREVVALVLGLPEAEPRPPMFFVGVESESPWEAEVYRLDEETQLVARSQVLLALRKFKRCMRDNEWPHRQTGIATVRLPGWRITEARAAIEESRRLLDL